MKFIARSMLVALLTSIAMAGVAKTPSTAKPKEHVADSVPIIQSVDIGGDDDEFFEEDAESSIGSIISTLEVLIPAADIYPEWTNRTVNPYNIKVADSIDSLHINTTGFVFPLVTHYRITSEFGFRRWRHHNGIDLKVNVGDSVVAAFDGMVRMAKKGKRGYGNYVVVRHNNGLETIYAHLNKLGVEENQLVKAGDFIGEGGNTGRSTGPHLHFEVRYLGQPINPKDLVDFNTLACHSDTLLLHKGNFAYVKEVEQTRTWVVKSGDTLGRIAQKTGVPVSRLCSINKIKKDGVLRIGQRIRYT